MITSNVRGKSEHLIFCSFSDCDASAVVDHIIFKIELGFIIIEKVFILFISPSGLLRWGGSF